jgi:hypothetical protein
LDVVNPHDGRTLTASPIERRGRGHSGGRRDARPPGGGHAAVHAANFLHQCARAERARRTADIVALEAGSGGKTPSERRWAIFGFLCREGPRLFGRTMTSGTPTSSHDGRQPCGVPA